MVRIHMVVVLVIGSLWSLLPCIGALLAYATLDPVTDYSSDTLLNQDDLTQARHIQIHFLKFRTYIPLEDINFDSHRLSKTELPQKDTNKSISTWCDHDKNVVWVPIKYKVPIYGERVLQWCLNIPSALRS